MDDDGNRKLNMDEFRKGVEEYGLNFSKNDIAELFRTMDIDRNGSIDYEEFLRRLRVSVFVLFLTITLFSIENVR
jgi:calcyphosin